MAAIPTLHDQKRQICRICRQICHFENQNLSLINFLQSPKMSQSSSQASSQDCFTADIQLAKLEELVEGVSWRVLDIQKSAENIRRTAYSYHDIYSNRVILKRATADLRDLLSKMETVEQYMNQQ